LEAAEAEELQNRPIGAKRGAHFLLPQALVENAIGMAGIDQIRNSKAFCLVAQAPSVDWVVPLHRYLRLGTHWDFHHSKTAAPKYQAQQDDVTKEQTTQAIAM